MQSVKELVLETTREERERLEAYRAEELKEQKKRESQQFSAEVAYLIKQFNYNMFNIDSTNKDVAKFITDRDGRAYITKSWDIPQTMPGYIKVKNDLSALKFSKSERRGRQSITRSSKYNKWKAALEKKFKVSIYIGRDYTYSERYGNSGYRTYDDEHFQGIVTQVKVKE